MALSIIKKQFFYPFLIIVIVLYSSQTLRSFYDSAYYIFLLHPVFQFFLVTLSVLIFILGVLSYQYDNSGVQFSIGLLFFIVGIYELFHMVTHLGMLSYISNFFLPSTYWFHIISDLTGNIGIFLIFLFRDFINKKYHNINKYKLLFAVIFFTLTSVILLLSFSKYLPLLITENGSTALRDILIYIAIIFQTFNIFVSIYCYFISKNLHYIQINNGFIALLLSEIFLLFAKDPCGIELAIGHILKVIGFFFFLLGIYYTKFSPIYHKKELMKQSRTRNIIKRKINKVRQKERKRIGQDLHDSLGQTLFVIMMQLKILRKLCPNDVAALQITNLEKLVSASMIEVKEIAFKLLPTSVEEKGLISALELLTNQFNHLFHIDIRLDCNITDHCSNQKIETAIFRICQESLTNAIKYADANQISVSLHESEKSIDVKVSDNGTGFHYDIGKLNKERGLGLNGMRERALSVNGTFSVITEIGKGTTIQVNIPRKASK